MTLTSAGATYHESVHAGLSIINCRGVTLRSRLWSPLGHRLHTLQEFLAVRADGHDVREVLPGLSCQLAPNIRLLDQPLTTAARSGSDPGGCDPHQLIFRIQFLRIAYGLIHPSDNPGFRGLNCGDQTMLPGIWILAAFASTPQPLLQYCFYDLSASGRVRIHRHLYMWMRGGVFIDNVAVHLNEQDIHRLVAFEQGLKQIDGAVLGRIVLAPSSDSSSTVGNQNLL